MDLYDFRSRYSGGTRAKRARLKRAARRAGEFPLLSGGVHPRPLRSIGSALARAVAGLWFVDFVSSQQGAPSSMRHLEQHGGVTQLVVDGKPFLLLAAELHNSSSSSLDYMKDIWPRLAATPMNTVLTPLSWELVEPQEGKYDFTLVDAYWNKRGKTESRSCFSGLRAGRTACPAMRRYG